MILLGKKVIIEQTHLIKSLIKVAIILRAT
jgi:hypothetical protein